jgi:hypothetical protein
MDPQEPIVVIPQTPQIPQTGKDNHWVSILAMAIFILFALGVVAFLYYQNQQLKSMLANYQTPVASPTPTATTDPTANWKTYTNKALGIEFKYPESYSLLKETPNVEFGFGIGTEPPTTYLTVSKKLTDFSKYKECVPNGTTPCFNNISWDQTANIADIKLGGAGAKSIYYTEGVDGDHHVIQVASPQKLELKMYIAGGKLDYNFQQILSTFKFLGTTTISPSSKPAACTQEAKLCPDGTSVGRTGPNCEFAPCP